MKKFLVLSLLFNVCNASDCDRPIEAGLLKTLKRDGTLDPSVQKRLVIDLIRARDAVVLLRKPLVEANVRAARRVKMFPVIFVGGVACGLALSDHVKAAWQKKY